MSSSERSPKSRSGEPAGDRRLVLDGSSARVVGVGAVPLDADEVLQLRLRVAGRGDERPVLALVDERDHVGVVEEVAQLLLDVAEVDVHDAAPHLVDREHRLDPLDAVVARMPTWSPA